jgi:hypothetical protein
MSEIKRVNRVVEINFAASATQQSNDPIWIGDISSCMFIFPAEFNTDTINIKTDRSGDTGFSFTAATGRKSLNSDEALAFFPMDKMIMTTNVATSAAATVTCVLKG